MLSLLLRRQRDDTSRKEIRRHFPDLIYFTFSYPNYTSKHFAH